MKPGEIKTADDYAALTSQHMAKLAVSLECMGVPREWILRGFDRGVADYRARLDRAQKAGA